MFARNVSLSATTMEQLVPARRKMRLSDAIRCVSGEAARRGSENVIAASVLVQREGRWPIEGIHVDWQLEDQK